MSELDDAKISQNQWELEGSVNLLESCRTHNKEIQQRAGNRDGRFNVDRIQPDRFSSL